MKLMSRNKYNKLSILCILLIFSSCATYKAQYEKSVSNWYENNPDNDSEIDHTFYFIGDGGQTNFNQIESNFSILKDELSKSNKNTTVLFLGDNIYEHGMPKKNHPDRKIAEQILDAQITLVDDFKGQTIFIPGNHDYYSDGILGLEREANYITKKLNDKDAFLPKNGCPIKKVEISDNIVLIVVDSQWFLEDWDNNPTMNDNCDISTREGFFDEFESLLKKNENKTVLISLHHPMFSNGSHGGQFSLKQQLYPVNN